MKFRLSTTGIYYRVKDRPRHYSPHADREAVERAERYIKSSEASVTERVDRMRKLGFRMKHIVGIWGDETWERMEGPEIEIPDLDALMAFVREWGKVIIDIDEGENTLEIYDDYREGMGIIED